MPSVASIIKDRLDRAGIRPNKLLGQNFLISEGIYRAIAEAAEIKPDEKIIEVGPGAGNLTELLIKHKATVIAVEKDRQMASFLKTFFLNTKRVNIVGGDILKFSPAEHGFKKSGYKIAANIPYYLTGRLMRLIFEKWPLPKLVILMVQKEVARRILAKPPHMNILAISVQYFADVKILRYVPAGNFYPAPRVDSALIKIIPRHIEKIDKDFQKNLFSLVHAGFNQKRKQVANGLAIKLKQPREKIERALALAGSENNARAENLSIKQWGKLTKIIFSRD